MSKGEFNTRCKFCGAQIVMRKVRYGRLTRWIALNKDNTAHRPICSQDAYPSRTTRGAVA